MFKRSSALCAMTVIALIVGVASASAASWNGYYLGLNAGYGMSQSDAARTIANNTYFAASSITALESASAKQLEENTAIGGAQFGVNWNMGPLVAGIEIDAAGFGNDASDQATVIYPCCGPSTFTTTSSLEQTWLTTARLRLAVPTDFALLYATGGYAGGDVKLTQTFSDTFSPIAAQSVSSSEFMSGWSAGGGIEIMIESGASIRVEYLYVDLGDIDAVGPIASGTTTSQGRAAVTDQVIRLGFNFKMD